MLDFISRFKGLMLGAVALGFVAGLVYGLTPYGRPLTHSIYHALPLLG